MKKTNITAYLQRVMLLSCGIFMLFASCVREDEYDNSPSGNLEALWQIMDTRYCFFEEKGKQLGVNWDEVHARYAPQTKQKLTSSQTFELLSKMIGELQDGHVNLSAPFDIGRSWSWKEKYPTNFSDSLQRKYIGYDYRIAAGMKYCMLDDNCGYVYCGSFENALGAGNLDEILLYLAPCKKLIIDVRNNGGGQMTSAQTLAARFLNEDLLVGYMKHKTGTGHNDFSEPREQILKPARGVRWQKSVVVLTNRAVYSSANEFVKYMKAIGRHNAKLGLENTVTIVGDRTGGGAGMPFSSELPNGWAVRFSACPMYDENGECTEFGIAPDVKTDISSEDYRNGIDTILETARRL